MLPYNILATLKTNQGSVYKVFFHVGLLSPRSISYLLMCLWLSVKLSASQSLCCRNIYSNLNCSPNL